MENNPTPSKRSRFAIASLVLAFAVVLLALGAGSCVRAGFVANDADTPPDSGTGPDATHLLDSSPEAAADQAAALDPLTPFGAPQQVAALNTAGWEDDPTLPQDMLEIYFERSNDIWRARRASLTAAWQTPQPVPELNSSATDTNPEITADGMTLFMTSTRSHAQASGSYDNYVSTRTDRASPWSTPTPVVSLNSAQLDCCVAPTKDLLTIYVTTRRDSSANQIYASTRLSTSAPWLTPLAAAGLNVPGSESNSPWVDAAGLVLYFSSDRAGSTGGSGDIWVTTRASSAASFAPPVLLKGVNSSTMDDDPWLSPDQRTIFFSSERNGSRDIFVASR